MSASHSRRLCVRIACVAMAAGAIVATGGCGDRTAITRRIALTDCRLPKVAQAVQCGTLEVPENRERPQGRRLSIFVAVLPANTLTPKPDPVVLLAGGPGQAASTLGPFALQLTAIRRTRDIVLIDQRGTGRSSPLDCAAFAPDEHAEFDTDPVPKSLLCELQLAGRDIDASQYTTSAWVADLDQMREALGYRQLNLWGGSYGTRVAQEYLRRHPDRVRSVVLDGVAPPSLRISFDVWRTRDDALDGVIAACRSSPPCAKAHPDPAATLAAIKRALGGGKTITMRDPRTGIAREMTLDYDMVIGALQPLTYLPEAATLIPELLALARAGDYAPLMAASLTIVGDLPEQFNPALHYSVTCTEDVPRVTRDERANGVADDRVRALARRAIAVCDQWPKGTMPHGLRDAGAQRRAGPAPFGRTGSGDAARVRRTKSRKAFRTAATSSRRASATSCRRRPARRGSSPRSSTAPGSRTLPQTCVDFLEHSRRPPSWPDRLAPQP